MSSSSSSSASSSVPQHGAHVCSCNHVKLELKEEEEIKEELTEKKALDSAPKANEQIVDCVKLEIKAEVKTEEGVLDIGSKMTRNVACETCGTRAKRRVKDRVKRQVKRQVKRPVKRRRKARYANVKKKAKITSKKNPHIEHLVTPKDSALESPSTSTLMGLDSSKTTEDPLMYAQESPSTQPTSQSFSNGNLSPTAISTVGGTTTPPTMTTTPAAVGHQSSFNAPFLESGSLVTELYKAFLPKANTPEEEDDDDDHSERDFWIKLLKALKDNVTNDSNNNAISDRSKVNNGPNGDQNNTVDNGANNSISGRNTPDQTNSQPQTTTQQSVNESNWTPSSSSVSKVALTTGPSSSSTTVSTRPTIFALSRSVIEYLIWTILEDGSYILNASRHQGYSRFKFPGVQCIAMCACAIVQSLLIRLSEWDRFEFDRILVEGDRLYGKSWTPNRDPSQPRHLFTNQLKGRCTLFGVQTKIRFCQEPPLYGARYDQRSLLAHLTFLFTKCDHGIVICGGSARAVMKQANRFYIFDSHSINSRGVSVSGDQGRASIFSFDSLKKLTARLFKMMNIGYSRPTVDMIEASSKVKHDHRVDQFNIDPLWITFPGKSVLIDVEYEKKVFKEYMDLYLCQPEVLMLEEVNEEMMIRADDSVDSIEGLAEGFGGRVDDEEGNRMFTNNPDVHGSTGTAHGSTQTVHGSIGVAQSPNPFEDSDEEEEMREVEENDDGDTEIDEVILSPPLPKESLPPGHNSRRRVTRLAAKRALVQLESSGLVIEVDDDDDDIDEVACQPVKRSRRGRPSPSPLLTTSDGCTDQRQIITISLVCPQIDCPEMMLAPGELNQHMWQKHSIRRHRCLVKDCGQSFDNHILLGQHNKRTHHRTTEWPCGMCGQHFSTHQRLSVHNHQQHQLGHFQCSFPLCTFTAESRGQVSYHYSAVHRALKFQCPVCEYQAPTKYSLKVHQRIHLGIKPYQCKWPDCHFAAVSKGDTVKHIRACHLKTAEGPLRKSDPKDYVEVLHQLLRAEED